MSRVRIADTVLPPALVAGVLEAGCDEAGRGCLAVILPEGYCRPGIVDSKKLSEARREELRAIIMEEAVAWAVGICTPAEIDELNILRASITAMHRAVDALAVRPGALAVDGNRFIPYPPYHRGQGRRPPGRHRRRLDYRQDHPRPYHG